MASEIEISNKGLQILDKCYTTALRGLPTSENADVLARDYLSKNNGNVHKSANKLINAQIAKCATTGFVTGLGGLITLPITIPADVAGNLYVQIRMIASLAVMGGYSPYDDEVKTMIYMTLVGMTVEDIIKITGIRVGNKLALQAVKQIPRQVIGKINQKVGFRLMTRFGEKGIINLSKLVPVAGGGIGAIFDGITTKIIASRAKKTFIG